MKGIEILRMIAVIVTIYQRANLCNGCSGGADSGAGDVSVDVDVGVDPGVDVGVDIGSVGGGIGGGIGGVPIGGEANFPYGGRRGLNSELRNVTTCRMEDFEGFKELSHRVDSIQPRDDRSMNKIVDYEMKRSGIQSKKNMCHPEGEKFECYNDYSKNHCICHLEQPLDHDNYNTTITELGEENNWKQPFITRYLTATICNSFYGLLL